jgi:plastocyanin
MNIIKSLGAKKVIAIGIVLIFLIGAIFYFADNSDKNNVTNTFNKSTTTTTSSDSATTKNTVKPNTNIQTVKSSVAYINIYKDSFSPKNLTIKAGTTVTWVNKDSNFQAVVADMMGPTSPDLVTNGTYSYKFTTPGIYGYHSKNNATTTGTIIVEKSL